MLETDIYTQEILAVLSLFFDTPPSRFEVKNTSHGSNDFREVILAQWDSGEKYAVKLADNDFTFAEKIEVWKKCAYEYRRLNYYCPSIFYSRTGNFPLVQYKGHNCIAYAEEFSKYRSADSFDAPLLSEYMNDAYIMTARVAAAGFHFTDFPSGYCLFDRFCPSDPTDEVMENALEWKRYAKSLPKEYNPQIKRIWQRWIDNRKKLEQIYPSLPTSVFQADLNPSNILLDDSGKFVGVYDFNLCGKDVLLNYLLREIRRPGIQDELESILLILKHICTVYHFSSIEKESAILLYRCIKPLWFTQVQKLKKAGSDRKAVQESLDQTEHMQTMKIDFAHYMNE